MVCSCASTFIHSTFSDHCHLATSQNAKVRKTAKFGCNSNKRPWILKDAQTNRCQVSSQSGSNSTSWLVVNIIYKKVSNKLTRNRTDGVWASVYSTILSYCRKCQKQVHHRWHCWSHLRSAELPWRNFWSPELRMQKWVMWALPWLLCHQYVRTCYDQRLCQIWSTYRQLLAAFVCQVHLF